MVTKRFLSPILRLLALSTLVLLCLGLSLPLFTTGPTAAPETGPKIWLDNSRALSVNYTGTGTATTAPGLFPGITAQPVAMANGDFDQDGVSDLAVGFSTGNGGFIAIHRGNLDAFAPQSQASFQAIAHNQFPAPFLSEAQTFPVSVSPDFIAAGDFTGQNHTDLVVASRGGSTLYIFADDGKGHFTPGQTINLPGAVTSLAAGGLGRPEPVSNLLVGISSPDATFLAVYGAGPRGLAPVAAFPLSAPASSINFGEFGDMGRQDAAFLSGGQVFILRSSNMQLTKVSLPVSAVAMALGSFVFDRNAGSQIALLGSNGSIHIAARNEFDPRVYTADEFRSIRQALRNGQIPPLVPPATFPSTGFRIVETFPTVGSVSSGQPPVFFSTRVSNQGGDDIMWMGSSGQMAVVSHANVVPGASTFIAGQLSLKPYSGSPLAAISTRVNVDPRPGILALHQGESAIHASMPLPDPTFFVNKTNDPTPTSPIANACNNTSPTDLSSSCSLREAILKANGDTIMLQANTTYTLSIAKVAGDFSGNNGSLYINNSVTIVGGDQNTTIIDANNVDKAISVNEDINPITNASASISNVTIQHGHNIGLHGQDGDGGCMEFDTGSSGTTTLSLQHVTLTNCNTTQGNGAGIAIFNFTKPGAGAVTISNSTISNNASNDSVTAGLGGGIWVSQTSRLTLSNSTVSGNTADNTNTTGGGGIATTNQNGAGSPTVTIHATTISGNHTAGNGGGINAETNLLVDQDSVISGNTSTNATGGGGLFSDLTAPDSVTLTKVTIINNHATAGAGGGIFNGSGTGGGGMAISFSRLAGNTANTAGTSNLDNDDTAITATDNWWGTNTPATTITTTGAAGSTTFDPFIVLSHTANPATINLGETATLTASFLKDNHGTAISASNLDVVLGLPITFGNAADGTISNAQGTIQPVSISTATESGSTVTITTAIAHGYVPGDTVTISGVAVAGYNGTFTIASTPTSTTFTYTDPTTGLANSTGGTANVGASGTATATFTGTIGGTPAVAGHADATVDNGTATATIDIVAIPPAATKAFGAATIPLNGTTSLTFTIPNGNAHAALTGVAFTDSLPAGLVVATPGNLSSTNCGGTTTAADGATSVVLSGGTIAIGATCSISVNVTGTTAGVKNNSVQATSTNAGTGATSTASLTVVAPPSISKVFNPTSIPLSTTTSLTFTITNPNSTVSLTGVGFTDTLPTGLTVANSTATVCGGTLTTTSPTGISLSGATIAASGQCQFSVTVTGATAGVYTNTTGAVTSNEGGTGNTATANLTVVAPPSIAKAFNPTQIPQNATTSLTFTITNSNTTAVLTGVGFTDTLPTGLTVGNSTSTVCGGTLTTTSPTGISLSGASIAAGAQCQFSVTVTGATAGQYTNTTGAVSSTNGGTGNTATANLTVIAPPSIAKSFNPTTIAQNTTTSLTFTITNPSPNTISLTGVGFTDTLPTGLTVANSTSTVCGGTLTTTSPTGISLTGATVAASGTCQFSVTVTGATAGSYNNTTGAVTSTEGGTGNTASAILTVVAPPSIAKAFNPTSIALNTTTSLQFTITNPNTANSLSGVGFTDTLPTGLTVANSTATVCGGTLTTTSPTGISLSGATIAASGQCQFSVTVTGGTAGSYTNTTGAVSSTNGGTGNTATANLTVVAPPSIAKAFNPTTIGLGATTSLTFTITNPAANTVALAGVAFTDTLPTGLTVTSSTSTACSGTLTTTNPTGISLTGATIAAGGTCQFSVTVTGAVSGQYTNTTGAVSSTNGGTGNTASANLTVATPPTITKAFNPTTIALNGTSTLTLSITNPNTNVALTGIAVSDNFPAGLIVAATPNLSNTCSGTATAAAGSGSLSLSGGTLGNSASCAVSVTVQGTTAGAKINTTGAITSNEGGTGTTATATLTVNQASTATTVNSSSNPAVFGQSVTFTATVTDISAGSNAQPTGSVQFVVDGVNFGSPVALTGASSNSSTATSQGTATLSVAGSPHSVTANYVNADGSFTNSSGSLAGGQTMTVASTNTAVVSSSNPSVFGQPVTFTATVTDSSAGSTAQPTGSVQFVVDGVNFGSPVTLTGASSNSSTATSQATATLSIAGSPHSVTANYVNADGNFTNSSGIVLGGQVVTKANTTVTVNSSQGTITLGDTVTFTATVTVNAPATGTPTGLVTFFDGSTPIGAGVLNQANPDRATFSTSVLAVGSHAITAIYNGDSTFGASPLSSPTTETVNLRGSTTSVALNPTTVGAGQASTATVTITDGGASTPPGTPDVFSATGAPATGRTGFTSTLFADGLVLVAGGTGADGTTVLKSAEIYSVSGAAFSTTGNLNTARTGAVAVLLPNGKVLVAGGSSDGTATTGALSSAELFDPSAGTFTPTSHNMTAARFGSTATILNSGKVLLAGGANNTGVLNSAELYDPATDTFTATGNLNAARTGASATLLGTGKVLVAGGSSDGTANGALGSAELFDPAGNGGAGAFTSVAGANPILATGRWQPEAALLQSGKVLIAGGQNSGGPLTSADLYDPAADSFTASAHAMNEARANGSAFDLPNGMVLLAGGTTSETVELYDADNDRFDLTGSLLQFDNGLVATLLNNGRVLVVGLTTATPAVSDAELYSPSFNPLGTVGFSSSDATDAFGPACVLTPSTSTASTCTSTVTPLHVGVSPHTITGTYPADAVHSGSSNTASLTVIPTAPPGIAKAFSAANVAQNGTVNVNFTIVNPNPAATLTGISFTDSLPAGLTVASPNNLNSNCGGTFTAVAGSSAISLTGGTVAPAGPPPPIARRAASRRQTTPSTPVASGQCVITLDLQVTGTGTIFNTTGAISANESGPGNPSNTASVNVVLAPTANKAFGAASIPLGGTTSLTFNLANPNTSVGLVNIGLTDTLPSGLVVANPNGLTGTCVPLAVTAANPGSNSIVLTALNLPAAGSCSFSVNVTGTTGGVKNNVTAPVTGTFDDGSGTFVLATGGTASASVTVLAPDLAIAKSHTGNFTQGDVGDTYQITVSNVGSVATAGTVTVTDAAPAGLIPTNLAGSGWTCTVTPLSCNRSDALAGGASYPPITFTTSVAVNAPTSLTNTATVSGGGETNTANDTATDPTTINQLPGPPLTITLMVPSTQTIKNGNSASFVFDVVSHSATLGSITFSCQGLPAKSACNFSPQSESSGDAQVTMTLTTTEDTAFAAPSTRRGGPVYAALFFPVLGLLSLAVAGRRGKKTRMRLAMFLGSLFVLLALFGCGGTPHNGTPTGAFPITVTATSAANPTVTATTQVVVTVQ